ncbi:MAG: nucleoside monophosphate kinase [Alphaproteobacteria bacterium]|nr:nucleoside monophosphate kinase [Alphaproteobacteria bacterium]
MIQDKKYQAYIFIGLPGAGKGTQLKMFKEHLIQEGKNCLVVEQGACLREYVSAKQIYSAHVSHTMQTGNIVPSALPVFFFTREILFSYKKDSFVLIDGTRKLLEAQLHIELLKYIGIKNICVIHIDIPTEESVERLLLRKRLDDTRDSIQQRQMIYLKEAKALLDFFQLDPDIHVMHINGVGDPKEISITIRTHI